MLSQVQAPASPVTLPGTWKLGSGRAITLQPREAGLLRIAHGRVWATFDGPHTGLRNDLGDHVLGAGGRLAVKAGQRLVIEAWSKESPAYFTWDPTPERAWAASREWARVQQPMADLRLALMMAGGAAVRLAAGLAGLAWAMVTDQPQERSGRGSLAIARSVRDAHKTWVDAGRAAVWAAPR
jgi:hypothetical protein